MCYEKNKDYVDDAILKGASVLYTKNPNKIIIDYYKDKIMDVKLIGITGTNGKTTTAYLIYQMLNSAGLKTSFIGTNGFYLDKIKFDLPNTTPSIDLLYNLILLSKENGTKIVVMEVSSHALDQGRVDGLLFDIVCVTNISKEHLNYHKNIKNYVNTKRKIINMVKEGGICILNKYDKYYKKFLNKKNNNIIVGKDYKIRKIRYYIDKTTFKINKKVFVISMMGKFNVINFTMAYISAKHLGCILNNFDKYLEPDGRMNLIRYNNSYIFVDFAHTPDAVLKVLKNVRKINKNIITIIGCGGTYDKYKRPIIGKLATKYSKHVIFTSDNPRKEDPINILNDITRNLKRKNFEVIVSRKDAIKKGINILEDNYILLVLGRGSEKYQELKDKKVYLSDREEIDKIIKKGRN